MRGLENLFQATRDEEQQRREKMFLEFFEQHLGSVCAFTTGMKLRFNFLDEGMEDEATSFIEGELRKFAENLEQQVKQMFGDDVIGPSEMDARLNAAFDAAKAMSWPSTNSDDGNGFGPGADDDIKGDNNDGYDNPAMEARPPEGT